MPDDDIRERIARAIEEAGKSDLEVTRDRNYDVVARVWRGAARIARETPLEPPPAPRVNIIDDPADPRIPDLWPDDLMRPEPHPDAR